MTVLLERADQPLEQDVLPAPSRRPAWRPRAPRPQLVHLPILVGVLDAVLFLIVRPDVKDLWAARARASAAHDGVGLTYWFSWFGGGSTPGNYSVLTPWLSALIGTEVLVALSAAVIPPLVAHLVRGSRHPVLAVSLAVAAAGGNLWCGRVPYLFGSVFGVLAVIAVRQRRPGWALAATAVGLAASPTIGAFLAIGLAGLWLADRTYRRTALIVAAGIGVFMIVIAIVFGAPGPQPFTGPLQREMYYTAALLLLARPPRWLRNTILLTVPLCVLVAVIPNGLGSNFVRLDWFILPVAVAATSPRRATVVALIAVLPIASGARRAVDFLHDATLPISSKTYYAELVDRLDEIPDLGSFRVEVVEHGAEAAYDALLNHANLARGWETQEDAALNGEILRKDLDSYTYRRWLDENAVGYVALPTAFLTYDGEYDLVSQRTPSYLSVIWSNPDWRLYKVLNPNPIVDPPAQILHANQASIVVDVPCVCEIPVRVRFSKYLQATTPTGLPAEVANDGKGWTVLRTAMPGSYQLRGALG